MSQENLVGLIDEADRLYLEFGAPSKTFGEDDKYANWQKRAVLADLQLMPNRVTAPGNGPLQGTCSCASATSCATTWRSVPTPRWRRYLSGRERSRGAHHRGREIAAGRVVLAPRTRGGGVALRHDGETGR